MDDLRFIATEKESPIRIIPNTILIKFSQFDGKPRNNGIRNNIKPIKKIVLFLDICDYYYT